MSKPWTDGEKMAFLNQVIAQLLPRGSTINYKTLNMPGRTTKSLQHLMNKIRTEGAAYRGQSSRSSQSLTATTPEATTDRATPPPNPTRTLPSRRARNKRPLVFNDDDDDDEEEDHKTAPRIKRQRPSANHVKKEVVDPDADTITVKNSDADKVGVSSDSELTDIKGEPSEYELDEA
ncbi:hypothetical protein F4818DRAFT_440296 [Hypoxylon cercidicola]|nr:hypothetical protein F4818DRAFT_440296 [Hypoxylon cercidicola]